VSVIVIRWKQAKLVTVGTLFYQISLAVT